jgi:hypothetical protein
VKDIFSNPPDEVSITAKRCGVLGDGFARLHIDDPIHPPGGQPHWTSSRGNLTFRTVEEVKRAIEALQGVLPVVDRLAALVPDGSSE